MLRPGCLFGIGVTLILTMVWGCEDGDRAFSKKCVNRSSGFPPLVATWCLGGRCHCPIFVPHSLGNVYQ